MLERAQPDDVRHIRIGFERRMNEQRTAIGGRPRPILDVFDALDHEGGPGLADRKYLHDTGDLLSLPPAGNPGSLYLEGLPGKAKDKIRQNLWNQ
jgi:hypothetical protein